MTVAAAAAHAQAGFGHQWLLSIKRAKGQTPHLQMPGPRPQPLYLTLPLPSQIKGDAGTQSLLGPQNTLSGEQSRGL